MPVSGTPVGAAGPTKLPQLKKDFNLAAAKPAPKAPAPPALKLNPPQKVAVAAPGLGKGVPMVPVPAAKKAAGIPARPKPAMAFNRAAQPGLKPAFQRAARPAVAAPPPAIRAKQDFAKAAASPNRPKAPQLQKTQTRTKTK